MWQRLVRPGLDFRRAFFVDRDWTVQITRAIWNVSCTICVRDFLTRPNYDLVANRNEHVYVCMYVCMHFHFVLTSPLVPPPRKSIRFGICQVSPLNNTKYWSNNKKIIATCDHIVTPLMDFLHIIARIPHLYTFLGDEGNEFECNLWGNNENLLTYQAQLVLSS